jgi:hypothetical protein
MAERGGRREPPGKSDAPGRSGFVAGTLGRLAFGCDFAVGGPVTRPGKKDHREHQCDQEGCTVLHNFESVDRRLLIKKPDEF